MTNCHIEVHFVFLFGGWCGCDIISGQILLETCPTFCPLPISTILLAWVRIEGQGTNFFVGSHFTIQAWTSLTAMILNTNDLGYFGSWALHWQLFCTPCYTYRNRDKFELSSSSTVELAIILTKYQIFSTLPNSIIWQDMKHVISSRVNVRSLKYSFNSRWLLFFYRTSRRSWQLTSVSYV